MVQTLTISVTNTFHSSYSGNVCLSLLYTFLLLFGQYVAISVHVILETLLMGKQYQAETFDRFISCSLQTKTLLLAWTAACASLSFPSSVCSQLSARPQYSPASNISENWDSSTVGLDQWWSLQELVSRCTVHLFSTRSL